MWPLFFLFSLLFLLVQASERHIRPRTPSISKNGLTVRADIEELNSTSTGTFQTTGITPLTLAGDRQSYHIVLRLGVVNYRVALDTASSDLWIMSSDCETITCEVVPRLPLAYMSETFQSVNDNGTEFVVSYTDGTAASGFVAREQMTLANLTIPDQVFGVITESNVTMTDDTSGLLGLGFPRLSSIGSAVTNSTPFFANLAQQGLLEYPMFGISLRNNQTSGSLTIGGVDATVVRNVTDISWNDVVEFAPFGTENNVSSYLQWAIPLAGITVGETEVVPQPTYPNITNNASLALIDLGAPGFYGPYPDVARIFSVIEGSRLVDSAGFWAIPCDTLVTITFSFGDQNYTLFPSEYLIGPAEGTPNLCLSWPQALPLNSDGIDWQMGTSFLRTVYSVFSYGINNKEPPMIGFYQTRNSTNITETAEYVSSFHASISATIATTLPNFFLSTPSPTLPPYTLNSSITAPTGGIVSSALATSTYIPALGTPLNESAIPLVTPPPVVQTFVVTSAGQVITTVSSIPEESPSLGVVPGWSNSAPKSEHLSGSLLIGSVLCFLAFSAADISL